MNESIPSITPPNPTVAPGLTFEEMLERRAQLSKEVHRLNAKILDEELARELYTGYAESCGWTSFKGDALPTWSEMAMDPHRLHLCKHWKAAATRAKIFLGVN